MYAFANGDPTKMLDPSGLGAVGESIGPSWIDQIWRAWVLTTVWRHRWGGRTRLLGGLNFLSLDILNDATKVGSGFYRQNYRG